MMWFGLLIILQIKRSELFLFHLNRSIVFSILSTALAKYITR